jgi:anti-sigma regulatory factor (Ser/Thr protein kinase)
VNYFAEPELMFSEASLIRPTARAGAFAHPALFYRGTEEYLAGTVPFVRDGLAAGEPVAVAVPPPNLDLLRAELAEYAGQVSFLDMAVVGRNPGRIIPGVLRAFADAHPDGRVRIIGEPIWPGRTAVEYPACVQHEALINMAFAGRSVTILCPYDVARLDDVSLTDAVATHPLLVDATGGRDSDRYAPERVVAAYNEPLTPPETAFQLSFDAAQLAVVRRVSAEFARRAGLPARRIDDLEVIVNELATNSVVHGGSGTLSIWAEDSRIVYEVRDRGRLTDPLVGRRPVDLDNLSGRGVLLVNYLADLVRVYTGDDGTAIRAYLDCF